MHADFDGYDTRTIAMSAHMKVDVTMAKSTDTAVLAAVLYRILVEVVRAHPTALDSVHRHFLSEQPELADAALTMLATFVADVGSASG